MDIINELWYGNISPFEQCTRGDKRLKELLKLVARNREELDGTLTDKQKEILEKFDDCYNELTDINEREVIVLDPMLATGGSAIDAISMIKQDGVKNIKFLSIISAPEGIEKVKFNHPDVQIYTASIDDKLNENGYILPGLGDAGDRIFGTK